jgi:hypothetical protein
MLETNRGRDLMPETNRVRGLTLETNRVRDTRGAARRRVPVSNPVAQRQVRWLGPASSRAPNLRSTNLVRGRHEVKPRTVNRQPR